MKRLNFLGMLILAMAFPAAQSAMGNETTATTATATEIPAAVSAADSSIVQTVREKLAADHGLSGQEIAVHSANGVVTLTGRVKTDGQADRAIELAQSVAGVTDVNAADLTAASSKHPMADTAITAKVKGLYLREKLFGDREISVTGIKVETTDGIVYLSGKVDTQEQADNAINLAKSVSGVREVKSALEVGAVSTS